MINLADILWKSFTNTIADFPRDPGGSLLALLGFAAIACGIAGVRFFRRS